MTSNPIKTRAESLADKMNSLTEKFNLSEELVTTGEEIEGYIQDKTRDIPLYESEDFSIAEYINLQTMVEDFKYVRESLRETTDNGRRVLSSVTLDLLDEDDESRASLITSFAELNKAVGDNMKLYMQSYRDISNVLLNLDKIKKSNETSNSGPVTNNTLVIQEPKSTADLIKELGSIKSE